MSTWGASAFVDENGDSDDKYSLSLIFPNEEYRKSQTDEFLVKLKTFENQILEDAVRNSESWWGENVSLEIAKHTFFPFLKYSKIKDTKKYDYTKPPTIRAKVPFYKNKWSVEIYDTKTNLLFPSEDENLTPMDFIPKLSSVACVLQCGGIWIGGKGWGLTWKLIQCVVKPREMVSVFGKCHIQLSDEDQKTIETQPEIEDNAVSENDSEVVTTPAVTISAEVEDSDTEDNTPIPVPVVEVTKKVIKKVASVAIPAVAIPATEVVTVETDQVAAVALSDEPAKPAVKKVIKKKASV
jgi:hypothetical protein